MNAVEIEEAVSELASQPFDSQEFAFLFLVSCRSFVSDTELASF